MPRAAGPLERKRFAMTEKEATGSAGPSPGAAEDTTPGLEARIRRLEEIVASLESSDLDLDRAMALFQEGVEHIRASESLLAKAELQVEELLAGEGGAGEERLKPFLGSDGSGEQ
jgi:exodeoxyribonuclease VII small subunit